MRLDGRLSKETARLSYTSRQPNRGITPTVRHPKPPNLKTCQAAKHRHSLGIRTADVPERADDDGHRGARVGWQWATRQPPGLGRQLGNRGQPVFHRSTHA